MKSSASKIQMTSLDELLGAGTLPVTAPVESVGEDKVVRLPLSVMHEFKGHPFRVLDDAKMAETVESIEKYGVLMPGIVRPDADAPGTYEIVAGHRRRRASQLAGLSDMPVIVKNLSDDEATVIMVDSNIQREDLLPSERAWAYRMKYEALKRMGVSESGTRNDTVLANEFGKSRNTIQRYIRLTYLVPELLEMVDQNALPETVGYDLSFLKEKEQRMLLHIIQSRKCVPNGAQAKKLHEYSKSGELTAIVMELLMEQKEDLSKVSLKGREIRKFFPETYTGKQIEEIIYKLLEEWQRQGTNTL